MQKLGIVIPSRLKPRESGGPHGGKLFLETAIRSIKAQKISRQLELSIYVGVDSGSVIPGEMQSLPGVVFVESDGRSQAKALNAGLRKLDADFVALLEDDDQWHPLYVEACLQALENNDFSSSTQLEFGSDGAVRRIFDFPTPSGWCMKRITLDRVGAFNEEYRWHLDNEWLGRLGESGLRRVHMVEATAPLEIRLMQECRPMLARCLRNGGPSIKLARHSQLQPLVSRTVHTGSGMGQIATKKEAHERSQTENRMLVDRFGRVPW